MYEEKYVYINTASYEICKWTTDKDTFILTCRKLDYVIFVMGVFVHPFQNRYIKINYKSSLLRRFH